MIFPIISIIITIIFFVSIFKILFNKIKTVELIGAAFLFGIGIESLVFFIIFSQLDFVSPQIFWIAKITELTVALIINAIGKKGPRINIQLKSKPLFSWSGVFWFGILCLFALSLVYTLYYPVHTTDSLYYFDFRSKIMYLSHTVSEISILPGWSYYPMFTSMIGLISRLSGFENPSFYYPLIFLSFALIFYSRIREYLNKNLASLITFLMYSTPLLYWQSILDGMTDMPYAIFFGVGVIYTIQYLSSQKGNNSCHLYFFSILGLGLSKWVRIQEPFWLVPLVLIYIKTIWYKKWWHLILGIILFYSIYSIWPHYISTTATTMNGVNTTVSVMEAVNTLAKNTKTIDSRLLFVTQKISSIIYQSLLPISTLFLLSLLFLPFIRVNLPLFISLFFIFYCWGVFIASTLFSTYIWSWMIDLDSSISRLTSFFVPLVWFYFSIMSAGIISKIKQLKLTDLPFRIRSK